MFVCAYSMGCMQMLNILTRPKKNQMFKEFKYTGMCLLCPFFATNETTGTDKIVPILKAAHLYDKNALTPEFKIDVDKEPEHYVHWYYDKENPF